MAAGQGESTEANGTGGKLTANMYPLDCLVIIEEKSGIKREILGNRYGRIKNAFVTKANKFTVCCLDGTRSSLSLQGCASGGHLRCVAGGFGWRQQDLI